MNNNSLLFFADKPEVHDELIGKFYELENVFVMRLTNVGIEQLRSFLISRGNCVVVLFVENSKDLAMSLLYKICNCSFSLPYMVIIFRNSTDRLLNHVRVHSSFKIFCMNSDDYSDDLVIDWLKKVLLGLSNSVVFPRLKSYSRSSTRFKIAIFLKKIGMFSYLTGYKYIVDAVELYVNNPHFCITKDIYRILSARYNTNSMNIDRCMRHAIEAVWRDSGFEVLKRYYLNDRKMYDNRPSVFDFVRHVAKRIFEKNDEINCNKKMS